MMKYNEFYFEVRNYNGQLLATFSRRWEAEKYSENHKEYKIKKIITK